MKNLFPAKLFGITEGNGGTVGSTEICKKTENSHVTNLAVNPEQVQSQQIVSLLYLMHEKCYIREQVGRMDYR